MLIRRLRQQKSRPRVDPEQMVEIIDAQFNERCAAHDACIAYNAIEPSKRLGREGHRFARGGNFPEICRQSLHARVAELASGIAKPGFIAIDQQQSRAGLPRQSRGDRPPDAASRACDQRAGHPFGSGQP